MFVEFPAGLFHRFISVTAGRRGLHDRVDPHVRRPKVIGGHATTDVAFGYDTNQLAVFGIFNHRRASAAGLTHRVSGVGCGIARRTARCRFNRPHHIAATGHGLSFFMFSFIFSIIMCSFSAFSFISFIILRPKVIRSRCWAVST